MAEQTDLVNAYHCEESALICDFSMKIVILNRYSIISIERQHDVS